MSKAGRVDFYVLTDPQPAARLRFACRLAEKAWHMEHRVHLHAASAAQAGELDDLLWTFRQGSFVPHEVITAGEPASSPVTIGHGSTWPPDAQLLINLDDSVPDRVTAFERVAEIVDDSAEGRRLARARYRHYQQHGCTPLTHHIGKTP